MAEPEVRADVQMMRLFYNVFPYPGRALFVLPRIEKMWLSHFGFVDMLQNGDVSGAREVWKKVHWSQWKVETSTQAVELAVKEFFSGQDKRLLLAGCGTDEPVLYAALHPDMLIDAVDLSQHSLWRARIKYFFYLCLHAWYMSGHWGGFLRGRPRMRFVCGDVVSALTKSNFYEYIVCYGVLHHQKNPEIFLKSLRDSLKIKGVIKLMVYSCTGRDLERSAQRLFLKSERRGARFVWGLLKKAWRLHLWLWGRSLKSKHRFSYIKGGVARTADAFLHPSDPGLGLREFDMWCQKFGLRVLYCCAKTADEGWVVGIENPHVAWNKILNAELHANILSNIDIILQKDRE